MKRKNLTLKLQQIFQKLNLSHTTINRKLSSLKHLFNFLTKKRLLKSNPVINFSGLKSAKPLPKSLSITQKQIYSLEVTEHTDS